VPRPCSRSKDPSREARLNKLHPSRSWREVNRPHRLSIENRFHRGLEPPWREVDHLSRAVNRRSRSVSMNGDPEPASWLLFCGAGSKRGASVARLRPMLRHSHATTMLRTRALLRTPRRSASLTPPTLSCSALLTTPILPCSALVTPPKLRCSALLPTALLTSAAPHSLTTPAVPRSNSETLSHAFTTSNESRPSLGLEASDTIVGGSSLLNQGTFMASFAVRSLGLTRPRDPCGPLPPALPRDSFLRGWGMAQLGSLSAGGLALGRGPGGPGRGLHSSQVGSLALALALAVSPYQPMQPGSQQGASLQHCGLCHSPGEELPPVGPGRGLHSSQSVPSLWP